jgi:hypothetical protein
MTEKKVRDLAVEAGSVQCTPGKREPLDCCRFCAHSTHFIVGGKKIPSPARAFCTFQRATEKVRLSEVSGVVCDDLRGEGFRSIMNIIS